MVTLHSTMFLLIICSMMVTSHSFSLHSTMFLLIPSFSPNFSRVKSDFTFHYVSINSEQTVLESAQRRTFTFHYVSINSNFNENAI